MSKGDKKRQFFPIDNIAQMGYNKKDEMFVKLKRPLFFDLCGGFGLVRAAKITYKKALAIRKSREDNAVLLCALFCSKNE